MASITKAVHLTKGVDLAKNVRGATVGIAKGVGGAGVDLAKGVGGATVDLLDGVKDFGGENLKMAEQELRNIHKFDRKKYLLVKSHDMFGHPI